MFSYDCNMVDIISQNDIKSKEKIKIKSHKSIEPMEELIKYSDYFYKLRMEAKEVDTIPATMAIKEKSIISWTISKKDQVDEVNLQIEAQPITIKIKKIKL